MLKSSTIPTAMRGGISTSHPDAGNALGQAITALRRGEPVLIRDNEISVLAVAAELVTEENLQRLRKISPGSVSVVLTRRRGVALRLSGALSISVSSQLPAAVIRNLVDPAASLGAEPAGLGPEPVVAEGGMLAAAALVKLASFLPAALVLRIGAAEAPSSRSAAISPPSKPQRCSNTMRPSPGSNASPRPACRLLMPRTLD
jgi:hypothetical protein